MLNRDEILNSKIAIEVVTVQGLGDVGLRVMSCADLERWSKQRKDDEKPEHFWALLLAKTICDPDGKRLFNDDDFDGIAELPQTTLITLWTAAARLNGILPDALDEETKKKSLTPTTVSDTSSAESSVAP